MVATEDFEALCKTAATAEALLREIEPARAVNMQADTILKNAQLKADGIVEESQHHGGTFGICEVPQEADARGKCDKQ